MTKHLEPYDLVVVDENTVKIKICPEDFAERGAMEKALRKTGYSKEEKTFVKNLVEVWFDNLPMSEEITILIHRGKAVQVPEKAYVLIGERGTTRIYFSSAHHCVVVERIN